MSRRYLNVLLGMKLSELMNRDVDVEQFAGVGRSLAPGLRNCESAAVLFVR